MASRQASSGSFCTAHGKDCEQQGVTGPQEIGWASQFQGQSMPRGKRVERGGGGGGEGGVESKAA